MLIKPLKSRLKTVVRALRRQVRPVRDLGRTDPVAAWEELGRRPFRATVELARCATLKLNAFRCDPDTPDPLAATLMAIDRGRCAGYRGSPLEAFFASWQPETLAEWFGLDPGSFPPDSPLLQPPPKRDDRLHKGTFLAHRMNGERPAGCLFYGPVNPDFGEITVRRALAIRSRIRDDGFRPDLTSLRGNLHIGKDGDWQVLLASGKHTAAALVSLGVKEAPLLLGSNQKSVIHRRHARNLPSVLGLLTQREAEQVFDRVFAFEQPPACSWRPWD